MYGSCAHFFAHFYNSLEPKFAILFYQRLSVIRPSVLPSAKCIKLFIFFYFLKKLLGYIPPNLVQSILMKRGIKNFKIKHKIFLKGRLMQKNENRVAS